MCPLLLRVAVLGQPQPSRPFIAAAVVALAAAAAAAAAAAVAARFCWSCGNESLLVLPKN